MSVRTGTWRKAVRQVTHLAFIHLLAGCTTTECDPGQGGFARGIGCFAGDGYGQRQQQKKNELDQAQQSGQELQAAYGETRARQRQVRSERTAAEAEFAALQRDLSRMQQQLANAKGQNQDLARRASELESEIRLLEQDSFTPDRAKQEKLTKLRERMRVLEGEVDQVLNR